MSTNGIINIWLVVYVLSKKPPSNPPKPSPGIKSPLEIWQNALLKLLS